MLIDAFDFDALAVDQQPALRIEPQRADAEAGFVAIDRATVEPQRGDGHVAVRRLRGRRSPQLRVANRRHAGHRGLPLRRYPHLPGRERGDGIAPRPVVFAQLEDLCRNAHRDGPGPSVFDGHIQHNGAESVET